ncbi:hypothetical protein N9157_01965 [Saprospiraceae bacterium]|nr:hypothetical protein [Saprospiraceae bacterium]
MKFKQRIFLLVILAKVIVFWRLWRHYSTGGFNMDLFQSTATLLLPTFGGYLTVIIASYISDQKKGITHNKYIAEPLVTISYFQSMLSS